MLKNHRWLAGMILLGLSACSSAPIINGNLPQKPESQEIVLEPGDEIEVRFAYWPEMDDVQFIREDGKISLQFIDEVEIAGLTPSQADQKITQLYSTELKNPEINVVVRSRISQVVFVGGEVREPGPIPMEGRMNLLEAVIAGGGFENLSANAKNVIVYRRGDDRLYAQSFNVQEILYSPESNVVQLQPNDIVYVTRTGIDKANQWVEQHISRLIPGSYLLQSAVTYGMIR